MSTFLNFGSLILGIISWITPAIAIKQYNSRHSEKYRKFYIVSFSSCLTSLCLQFFEINRLVQIQDWSSLMDITGTLKWSAAILAIVTILLNIITFLLCQEKEKNIS